MLSHSRHYAVIDIPTFILVLTVTFGLLDNGPTPVMSKTTRLWQARLMAVKTLLPQMQIANTQCTCPTLSL